MYFPYLRGRQFELIALRDKTGISFSRLVNGSIKEFIDKYDGRAFKVK